MSSLSSAKTSRFRCPCQYVPLSLSSATAAEHGDVAALARRLKKSAANGERRRRRANGSVSVGEDATNEGKKGEAAMISDGGITPLHLAAQHGHPAAVSLLLREGGCDVDTGWPRFNSNANSTDETRSRPGVSCGATPLHRAAFSGAVASMQVLLSWRYDAGSGGRACDLLARDTSVGDERTPLHKAVAGGRPLAVALLLNALREDSFSFGQNEKQQPSILRQALLAKDAHGKTPLQLSRSFTSLSPHLLQQERQSVRRWDNVAAGEADWFACENLIRNALAELEQMPFEGKRLERLGQEKTIFNVADSAICIPCTNYKETTTATDIIHSTSVIASFSNAYSHPFSYYSPLFGATNLPKLPSHLSAPSVNSNKSLLTLSNNCQQGRCRTSSWESAFTSALALSVHKNLESTTVETKSNSNNPVGVRDSKESIITESNGCFLDVGSENSENHGENDSPTQIQAMATEPLNTITPQHTISATTAQTYKDNKPDPSKPSQIGRACASCGNFGISFFRSANGLVCHQCRPRSRFYL